MRLNLFYSFPFRVFDKLTNIFSGTIFALIAMSASNLGIAFFNLEHVRNPIFISLKDNSINNHRSVLFGFFESGAGLSFEGAAKTIFSLVVICCGLTWPFFLCHYGTFATERIRSIDQTVYNANWPDYPPDVRKYIILIIAQSRSNVNFNGFKILSCNLEIFAKVRKDLL